MVTGTSVLGITFDGGVMIAADTLGIVQVYKRFQQNRRRTFGLLEMCCCLLCGWLFANKCLSLTIHVTHNYCGT